MKKKGLILRLKRKRYKIPTLKSTKCYLEYLNTAHHEKGEDTKIVPMACRISGLIPNNINPGNPRTVVPGPTHTLINPDTLPKRKHNS